MRALESEVDMPGKGELKQKFENWVLFHFPGLFVFIEGSLYNLCQKFETLSSSSAYLLALAQSCVILFC